MAGPCKSAATADLVRPRGGKKKCGLCGGTVGVGQNTNYTGYISNKGSVGSQNELYIRLKQRS